jgi:sugar phosphate isomerase/epimerase
VTAPIAAERPLALGVTTFAWLYQAPLPDVLRRLEDAGVASFELAALHPHVGDLRDPSERAKVRRSTSATSLTPVSVNPTFVDINLVSTDPLFRAASVERMLTQIELAADIGAPRVVSMIGRLHALYPATPGELHDWLAEALDRLLPVAQEREVVLCLENSPFGYMATGADLRQVVLECNDPHLRILYDAANALAVEDAGQGIAGVKGELEFAHISDCWRHRWAHTSPGRGEVDFRGFAQALRSAGFQGPTIYELIDGEPVDVRLEADLARFETFGWSRSVVARSAGQEP